MIVAQRDTQVVESAWIFLTYIAAHIFLPVIQDVNKDRRETKWNCCITQYLPLERIVDFGTLLCRSTIDISLLSKKPNEWLEWNT